MKPKFSCFLLKLIALLTVSLSHFARAEGDLDPSLGPSDDFYTNDGFYVSPNETDFNRFIELVRGKKGVAISVGTFRAIQLSANGDFEKIILFDCDKAVVDFNQAHLALIASSPNASTYLRSFQQKSSDNVEAARMYRALRPHTADLIKRALSMIAAQSRDSDEIYFLNENQFTKVRNHVSDGRFVNVNGDLAGAKTLKWVAGELRAQGRKVSILDISNSLDHIATISQWWALFDNLSAIPWATDARVLMTTAKVGSTSGFDYFTASPIILKGYILDLIREVGRDRYTGDQLLKAIRSGRFKLVEGCESKLKTGLPLSPGDSK